jgi:dipeptidase D
VICDENKVHANNTSLGADNGIAVAMMLSLLSEGKPHGDLEFLVTSDEETGMTGASNVINVLDSKYLINLDSEEDNQITLGCNGGGHVDASINEFWLSSNSIKTLSDEFFDLYSCEVVGLNGGHSGCDIHLARLNAIKAISQLALK